MGNTIPSQDRKAGLEDDTEVSDGPADSSNPSRSDLYSILGNKRRRDTLKVLRHGDTPVELDELIDRVAAIEYDKPIPEVTANERKRVQSAVKQSHLPKIEASGLIVQDPIEGTVQSTESLDELDIYLKVAGKRGLPSSAIYLLLSVIGAAVMSGLVLDVEPMGILPDTVWATLVVGMFGVTALVHLYYIRQMRVEPL